MTRLALLLATLALLALPRPAAADFLLTVTGRFAGLSPNSGSERFDGTDTFENDLPPLFDLGRLAGGTFTATAYVPAGGPPAEVNGSNTFARYDLDRAVAGVRYTLFDAGGAVVHTGTGNPQAGFVFARVGVSDNIAGSYDGVFVQSDAGAVSGLLLRPPLGGDMFQSGGATITFTSSDLSTLSDLAIPTDAATYRRFESALFNPSVAWFSAAPDGEQYEFVVTALDYTIDSVTVSAVPEPASLGLLAAGGVGLLVARRRARAAG